MKTGNLCDWLLMGRWNKRKDPAILVWCRSICSLHVLSLPVWVPWLPALLARLISDSKLVVGMSVKGSLSCVLALG